MEKRLLNVQEFSNYMGMPVKTVYTYVHMKQIPKNIIVRIGRALRFDKEEADKWINEMKASSSSIRQTPDNSPGLDQ